jgi:hypothetical protein
VVGRQRHADRQKLRAAGWCHGQGRHEGAGGKERGRHSGSGTASEPRLAQDWAEGQKGLCRRALGDERQTELVA